MRKHIILAIVIALTLEPAYTAHAEDFSVSDAQIVNWDEQSEVFEPVLEEKFPGESVFEEEKRNEEPELPVETVQAAEENITDQDQAGDYSLAESDSQLNELPTDGEILEVPEDAGSLPLEKEQNSSEDENADSGEEPGSDDEKQISINNCTLTLEETLIYTGKPLKQKYSVKDMKGNLLLEGVDYKAENLNNVNIGTGTLKITGIGNYTGTLQKKYKITLGKVQLGTVESVAYDRLKLTWKKKTISN